MKLSELKEGQKARVLKINESGPFNRRVRDMGVTPGAELTFLKRAPLGDPISFKIKCCSLSLRQKEADKIIVEVINEDSDRR